MSDVMDGSIKERLRQWQKAIDALKVSERLLLFVIAVVLVFGLLHNGLMDSAIQKKTFMSREYEQIKSQIIQHKSEKKQFEMMLLAGVNKTKLARVEKLNAELSRLDERIQASMLTLIPPKLMPQVLETVLLENNSLQLISLENRPVASIIEQGPEQPSAVPSPQNAKGQAINKDLSGLYKHSFVISLEGDYPAAVEYFESLSDLPWRFNWDSLHYQVIQYPKASISLEVHTVSLSEGWIGV
jgi:MSHA biogenesis protein MshJ